VRIINELRMTTRVMVGAVRVRRTLDLVSCLRKYLPLRIGIDNRYTFYLHQKAVLEKARNLEQGCGRIVVAEKGAMHLAKRLEVSEIVVAVAHKNIDLDNVLHLPTS